MDLTSPPEVVRRLFEARAAGEVHNVLALLHPHVVATLIADGRTYRGRDAVAAYLGEHVTGRERTEVELRQLVVEGDAVTVHGRIRIFSAGSLSDSPATWSFEVVGGLVTRIRPVVARARAATA